MFPLWGSAIRNRLAGLTGTDHDRSRTGQERGGGTRAHEGQGRGGGGGCHTVRHSHRSTMATGIKGQSEKKRQGHRDDNGTVAFLLLPILILGDGGGGGGSAVECGVLHDDTVADIVFCFVSLFWLSTE